MGVKITRNLCNILNGNVVRQETVEGHQKLVGGHCGCRLEMGNLGFGMDSRIGPPRSHHGLVFPGDFLEAVLQDCLDGGAVGLYLPPVIAGSLIFDDEFQFSSQNRYPAPAWGLDPVLMWASVTLDPNGNYFLC